MLTANTARRILLTALAALLSACALFQPLTHESEVRARYGSPTLEQQNADGTRRIAYAQQPEGEHYWQFLIAPDGQILQQKDGLGAASLRQIRAGMSLPAVHQQLGPPRSEQRLTGAAEFTQEWRIQRRDPGAAGSFFLVLFDDKEKVVQTRYRHEYRPPWRDTALFFGEPMPYYSCGWLLQACDIFPLWLAP